MLDYGRVTDLVAEAFPDGRVHGWMGKEGHILEMSLGTGDQNRESVTLEVALTMDDGVRVSIVGRSETTMEHGPEYSLYFDMNAPLAESHLVALLSLARASWDQMLVSNPWSWNFEPLMNKGII